MNSKTGTSDTKAGLFTKPGVVALVALAYTWLLHYAFASLIAPTFAYAGYRYRSPEWDFYFYAVCLVVLVALVLPRRIERPSGLLLWVLFTVAVAPSILVPQYTTALQPGESLIAGLAIGSSFLAVALLNRAPVSRAIPTPRLAPTGFWLLIGLVSALVYTYMLATVGLQFQLLALTDVYDVRADFKAELVGGGLLGYLLPMQANVINPAIVLRGLYARRWSLVAAGFAGQLLIYSSTGFKTVLFSVPLIIALAWFFRRSTRPAGALIMFGAVVAAVAAIGLDRVLGSVTWTSLLVRRFLITPGLLSAVYIAVFAPRPKAHLGHSIFAGFVDYPYLFSPPSMVGRVFFNSPAMSANGNLFADGYVNFGYPGVAGAALVLLIVLRLIDGASAGLPIGVASLILVMPAISLANSGILTTLTTHGLLGAIALLAILPKSGWTRAAPTSRDRQPSSLR